MNSFACHLFSRRSRLESGPVSRTIPKKTHRPVSFHSSRCYTNSAPSQVRDTRAEIIDESKQQHS